MSDVDTRAACSHRRPLHPHLTPVNATVDLDHPSLLCALTAADSCTAINLLVDTTFVLHRSRRCRTGTVLRRPLHSDAQLDDLQGDRPILAILVAFPRISQTCLQDVLQRFGFQFSSPQPTPLSTGHSLSAPPSDESVEPSGPYSELLGCLMYLMTCTRSDLAYPLSLWLATWLLVGTESLGSGSVSWWSTCSSSVFSSICEAEIYAEAMAAQELRWLTYLLTDLGEQPRSPLQRGQLRLAYVATRANTADIFTKALQSGDHQHFSTVLGLVPTLPHLLTA
ncbi:unnamed protein product [Closterium sp. NIES-53]